MSVIALWHTRAAEAFTSGSVLVCLCQREWLFVLIPPCVLPLPGRTGLWKETGKKKNNSSSSDVFLSSTAGLQATTKHSGFPVRMENAVPIVPQAPAAQPLQIQSGVLTQVKKPTQLTAILGTVQETCLPLRCWVNTGHSQNSLEG